jgi:membrane-associated phospholipid phosphatase
MPHTRWNPEGRALWPLVWRDARWPVYVMAAHVALAVAVDVAGLLPVARNLLLNVPAFVTMLAVSALVLPVLLGVSRLRHHSWRAAQRRYLTLRPVIGVLVVAVFVAEESQIHEAFKRLLGRVNPFRWDAALSHASILLHGGVPAWRWLNPVFHAPRLTAALDTLYLGWFPIVFVLGCLLAWLPRRRLRQRALLTWGLVWLGLGTVLAQIFSSAGPVYYHHVVSGPDPYAPLMAHLDSVNTVLPLGAVRLHASVWANLHRVHDLRWLHISAFPSMHVAVPAVFACLWWRQWRPAGVLLWAVTVIILIGSIYLGWHYAVDGYAAILGVLACWWLAGRLLRRRPARRTVES